MVSNIVILTKSLDYISPKNKKRSSFLVFSVYWLILFILYLPAAKAGRVGDFPGWVNFLNSNNFFDYINRKGSGIASMYQFTQIVSYFFYRLFGTNAWLWHLLYISLQALNALLLFVFFRRLFESSSVKNAVVVSFSGTLLFCVSPYISEVVVWESSFHYLLSLLLMLIVLICAQHYLLTRKKSYGWLGGVVFFLSSYSLEVFYLTPLFVFTLAVYYRSALNYEKRVVKELLLYFTLPQIIIFIIYFSLLHVIYHSGIAHIGTVTIQLSSENLSKALKYIFHILFFGRFFHTGMRNKIYHFCALTPVLWIFYSLFTLLLIVIILRYRRLAANIKVSVLLLLWVCLSVALVMPLWFPETGLVILDRYSYVLDAFIFMFVCLLLNNCCNKPVFITIIFLYALLNIRFTHKVNAYWQQSAHIVNNLVATFPNDASKIVLLLDLPECLDGVQMVGTRDDGEFRMMYNAIMPQKITNPVYDVEAFYLSSPADGAHINVLNDSTIRVTLNQWGTWWLYYGLGATSYENADFRVDMRDEGHWYDLILKHPVSEYLLLYNTGDQWQKADLNKKNIDQY